MSKRIYIAGPMMGITWFNFPEFDEAARYINSDCYDCIAVNPADIDRDNGFDPNTLPEDYDWSIIPKAAGSREEIIRRDVDAVLSCSGIYMLPGWEKSTGAKAELHLARWAGLDIHFHRDAENPYGPIAEAADYIEPPASCAPLSFEAGGSRPVAVKDSNPKDNVGSRKPGISAIPCKPLQEAGLALSYGGMKYGRSNWRSIGVRASVYYDAAMRHLMAWWEGEDIDPVEKGGSGLPHLAHAIAGLMVYRDAELAGMVTDDRPIAVGSPYAHLEAIASEIFDRYPNPVPPFTEKTKHESRV